MNKYAKAWNAVRQVWHADKPGESDDECRRQVLLRTLREASTGQKVGDEATVFVLDEAVEYFNKLCLSGIKQLRAIELARAREFADVIVTHRVFDDEEFAAYVGLLSAHFDAAPKEPEKLDPVPH